MRKSLIEINRPETKRFGDYRQLADHLNEVKDSSEWTIVRAEDTSFDGESGSTVRLARRSTFGFPPTAWIMAHQRRRFLSI